MEASRKEEIIPQTKSTDFPPCYVQSIGSDGRFCFQPLQHKNVQLLHYFDFYDSLLKIIAAICPLCKAKGSLAHCMVA